jgi:predicted dehydrogenase
LFLFKIVSKYLNKKEIENHYICIKLFSMLNAGVIGAGHLGKIHLKLLKKSIKYKLVGFYDSDAKLAKNVSEEFGYKSFSTMENLIEACDIVDVVTPTLFHFDCAKKVLNAGRHLFIEKPITKTVKEAETIRELAKKNGVRGQVGQVERFNPAFTAVNEQIDNPMFIESHRLAEFNPRGTDVSVVLDLMIHDIDAILSVVKSSVKTVTANGVSVISQTPDIANARIEFENGCVANLTASRISMKNMRKSRFFQKDAYISIDFLEKKCEVVKMKDAPKNPDDFAMILTNAEGVKKQIYFENPNVDANNAILDELEAFADAINKNTTPIVTLGQGTEALRVAMQIIENFKDI